MRTAVTPVAWEGWGPAAFARATRENVPIFLYLFASWSAACRRLERDLLSAGPVVAVLAEGFVPVRVDVDLCPEVADRYGLGGWPSLLVLTPEGDVLTGGQHPDPHQLAARLARVRDVFRERRAELHAAARGVPQAPTPVGPGHAVPGDLPARFLAGRPEPSVEAARWWLGSPAALRVAIASAGHDEASRTRVEHWLDDMADALIDRSTGGVNAAGTSETDSEEGERVVTLHAQASMLLALADAVAALPGEGVRALLSGVSRFLRRDLRHPSGGFLNAIALTPGEAAPATTVLDLRRFVGPNAEAARALFRASQVTGDAALAELAILVLERVVVPAFERGAGLAHVIDPAPANRGWLADQVAAAAAALEAFDASGMRVYLDLGEELMRLVLRHHGDADAGALRDIDTPVPLGWLAHPRYPLAANGLAAQVFVALARRTGAVDLERHARDLVGACAPIMAPAGPDAAELALAAMALATA